MDKMWAPWRSRYITHLNQKVKGCVFCKIIKEKKDKENYIFIRTKHSFAVLNLFPYNNGHVLVLPNRHVRDTGDFHEEEIQDIFKLINHVKNLLKKRIHPDGFNIGMNLGKYSGAGVPGHAHFHIVPRWKGDVNFMPVLSNTKVISQSLRELYLILKYVRPRKGKRS